MYHFFFFFYLLLMWLPNRLAQIKIFQTISLTLTLAVPSDVDDFTKHFSASRPATFTPSSLFQRPARLPCCSASNACKRIQSGAVNQTHDMSSATIWTNSGLSKVRFRGGSPQLGKLCKSLNSHFDTVLWERAAVMDGRPLNDLGFGGLIDRHCAVCLTTRELHLWGHKWGGDDGFTCGDRCSRRSLEARWEVRMVCSDGRSFGFVLNICLTR